jgi:hypothetical protein
MKCTSPVISVEPKSTELSDFTMGKINPQLSKSFLLEKIANNYADEIERYAKYDATGTSRKHVI